MIGIIATLKTKDGQGEALEALFAELTEKVLANEPGAKVYQLTKSRSEANTYKVLELYVDQDALTAHGKTDYFREIGRRMGEALDGRPTIEVLDAV